MQYFFQHKKLPRIGPIPPKPSSFLVLPVGFSTTGPLWAGFSTYSYPELNKTKCPPDGPETRDEMSSNPVLKYTTDPQFEVLKRSKMFAKKHDLSSVNEENVNVYSLHSFCLPEKEPLNDVSYWT